jgi:hypothetical protein
VHLLDGHQKKPAIFQLKIVDFRKNSGIENDDSNNEIVSIHRRLHVRAGNDVLRSNVLFSYCYSHTFTEVFCEVFFDAKPLKSVNVAVQKITHNHQ